MNSNLGRREFLFNSTLAAGALALGGPAKRLKVGVAGLKHVHVNQVLKFAKSDPRVTLVALAEDDPQNRQQIEKTHGLPVRHRNCRELLAAEDLDAVIVCEDYGHRGEAVIAALRAGKHVFCDKPLCTRLEELTTIAGLAAEKHLEVHVDLSLRHYWARAATMLRQGEIGEIVSCTYAGPHGLHYQQRPRWYFEPARHGGIINDLMGHGVDFVHWITRRPYTEVVSATRASVGLPQHAAFETVGEATYRLEGGATAFGHVDYLVPAGHSSPWRFFITGTKGDAVISERDGFVLRPAGGAERRLAAKELRANSPHPFTDFVALLADGTTPLRTTAESLHCARATLVAQQAAETEKTHLRI